jgi:hypothetical protein
MLSYSSLPLEQCAKATTEHVMNVDEFLELPDEQALSDRGTT